MIEVPNFRMPVRMVKLGYSCKLHSKSTVCLRMFILILGCLPAAGGRKELTSSPYDDVGLLSFGSPSQRSQAYPPFSPRHQLDKQEPSYRAKEVNPRTFTGPPAVPQPVAEF